ncbi:MAG: hypothetical protein JXL97_08665 [Bacteroidales bacterium]|nr:hypothetical protein [Bacteroidales bacterium]
MNLIIYVDLEVLIFFNENAGKIEFLPENNSVQDLFFYYDKFSGELKNNANYKAFCLEQKNEFFCNILSNLHKNEQITVGNNPQNYTYFLRAVLNKISGSYETVKIIYSAELAENTKTVFEQIVKSSFGNVQVLNSFAEYSIKSYLLKNQQTNEQVVFVLESFSDNIYISKANVVQNQITVTDKKVLSKTAYKSDRYALAKKLTDDIYRIYKPQNGSTTSENIEYVYLKLSENYKEIINQPKEFVVLSTRLVGSSERYIVKIKPEEIKYLADNFAKSIVSAIDENLDKNAKLIVVGEIFKDSFISDKLGNLSNNIVYQDSVDVLASINKEIVAEDEYSTMFLQADQVEQDSELEPVTTLEISSLEIGVNIKLTNYDPSPGKGYSNQLLEYVGEQKFVVIESTRSLKSGDLVESIEGVWHQGIKVVLNVFRGGKKYGKFQTREIQTIEILREKK